MSARIKEKTTNVSLEKPFFTRPVGNEFGNRIGWYVTPMRNEQMLVTTKAKLRVWTLSSHCFQASCLKSISPWSNDWQLDGREIHFGRFLRKWIQEIIRIRVRNPARM